MSLDRVSAIIKKDNKILLMHRVRKGHEFFCLPGGHMEEGESDTEALTREIKEETGLDIVIDRLLWELPNKFHDNVQRIFLVLNFRGELTLGDPEKSRNTPDNSYHLEWYELSDLSQIIFYPAEKIGDIQKLS